MVIHFTIKSISTLYRWLKNGIRLGFYRVEDVLMRMCFTCRFCVDMYFWKITNLVVSTEYIFVVEIDIQVFFFLHRCLSRKTQIFSYNLMNEMLFWFHTVVVLLILPLIKYLHNHLFHLNKTNRDLILSRHSKIKHLKHSHIIKTNQQSHIIKTNQQETHKSFLPLWKKISAPF